MNPTIIGIIVFTCSLGGALFGMWLRTTVSEHHLDADSKDTIKLGIGLIATITALVLGLVTAAAKSSFDAVDTAVKQTAIEILVLDRVFARYGSETAEIRKGLQHMVGARIDMIWPQGSSKPTNLDPLRSGAKLGAEGLTDSIRSLKPRDDSQRALQSRALDLVEEILKTRWLASAGERSSIPVLFFVIVLFWLTVIFASFGLLAPRNGTVVAVFAVCALSVASILFLIVELDTPFDGLLRVSPDPMHYAVSRLNT